MTYSYTQIAQYLGCPRRYRYRYLDGWQEKETRATMLFGRAFENAIASYFRHEDSAEVWLNEWSLHRNSALDYSHGDSWDSMLHQGIHLLERFAQDEPVNPKWPLWSSSANGCPRSSIYTQPSLKSNYSSSHG